MVNAHCSQSTHMCELKLFEGVLFSFYFSFLFFKKKEVGGGGEYIKENFKTTINFTIKNLQIDLAMNVIGATSPINYFFCFVFKS